MELFNIKELKNILHISYHECWVLLRLMYAKKSRPFGSYRITKRQKEVLSKLIDDARDIFLNNTIT